MNEQPQTRRCPRCKEEKPVTAFTKTDRWCKECRLIVNANYRRGYALEDAFNIEF